MVPLSLAWTAADMKRHLRAFRHSQVVLASKCTRRPKVYRGRPGTTQQMPADASKSQARARRQLLQDVGVHGTISWAAPAVGLLADSFVSAKRRVEELEVSTYRAQ